MQSTFFGRQITHSRIRTKKNSRFRTNKTVVSGQIKQSFPNNVNTKPSCPLYLSSTSIHSKAVESSDNNTTKVLRTATEWARMPALIAGISTVSNN
jgi:hypothetical protein